jgi:hypothetical protein
MPLFSEKEGSWELYVAAGEEVVPYVPADCDAMPPNLLQKCSQGSLIPVEFWPKNVHNLAELNSPGREGLQPLNDLWYICGVCAMEIDWDRWQGVLLWVLRICIRDVNVMSVPMDLHACSL